MSKQKNLFEVFSTEISSNLDKAEQTVAALKELKTLVDKKQQEFDKLPSDADRLQFCVDAVRELISKSAESFSFLRIHSEVSRADKEKIL